MKINVVDRNGVERTLDVEEGEALVQPLSFEFLVEATCGGEASCATCQIYIEAPWLDHIPAPGPEEAALLPELLNARPNSRLACQVCMHASLDGMRLTVAPEQ